MSVANARSFAFELIKKHGEDPISTACLQSGLSYFTTSFGVQAYKQVGRTSITLGGPICAAQDQRDMMLRFLQANNKTVFCYLSDQGVKDVHGEGLYIAGMGIDRYVDHRQLYNAPSKVLKGALKHADKANLYLTEVFLNTLTTDEKSHFSAVQESYLNNFRYKKEITFINTPLDVEKTYGRRYFFMHSHSQTEPFGFIVLNPYYSKSTTQGYLLDIIRFSKCKIWGVWLSCVSKLSRILEDEGVELSLGFCPLSEVSTQYDNSALLSWQVQKISHYLGKSDYASRLYQLKKQIPGESKSRYFASHSRNGVGALNALFLASGVKLSKALFQGRSQ